MSAQIPETQQAWMVMRKGEPKDALEIKTIAVPKPGPGQVLLKVEAAALNPIGYKIMRNIPNLFVSRPHIAEKDLAGTVVSTNNSTRFKPGDKVIGFLARVGKDTGALAQYIVAEEGNLAIRPDTLSVEEGAGLPLVACTSWICIFEIGKVEEGQHVFVNGGNSSVGITAIQMLKAHGCKVSTSCSTKNIDLVKKFGADVVYDYTTSPLPSQLSTINPPTPKFHFIIDAVGSWPLYYDSESYLAPGGLFISPGSGLWGWSDFGRESWGFWNAFFRPTWMGGVRRNRPPYAIPNGERMDGIADLATQGKLTVPIDSVFEWEDVLKAYDRLVSKRAAGKIVVKIPA
ncbi:NAD(P)-binding protein [Cantharellus anzutake]|uniref:NAD(P)-binding protein n=1 Tax=Cantharellus anzutake TaxID=1750568 RepID=UPI0019049AD8|nr:NAD(P)-binding protein [Cantharellus anzutake]KAF8328798.1 NAD(P)-binding protein [Cantharellus anzutake]